jgi:hypothetical protein
VQIIFSLFFQMTPNNYLFNDLKTPTFTGLQAGSPHCCKQPRKQTGQNRRSLEAKSRRRKKYSEKRREARRLSRCFKRIEGTKILYRQSQLPESAPEEVIEAHLRIMTSNVHSLGNLSGCSSKFQAAFQQAESLNAHVVVITETWLTDATADEKLDIGSYRLISRRDRGSIKAGGGVAVWAHQTVAAWSEDGDDGDGEVLFVSLWTLKGKMTIAGTYRPPGSKIEEEKIEKGLARIMSDTSAPQLTCVCGDLNSHDPNSLNTSMSGLGLKQYVKKGSFARSDKICEMFFANIKPSISHHAAISDHDTIIADFDVGIRVKALNQRRFLEYSKADWNGFRLFVKKNLVIDRLEHYRPDDLALKIDEVLQRAITKFIPSSKEDETEYSSPWWDSDCHKALTELLANPSIESREDYRNVSYNSFCKYRNKMRQKLSKCNLGSRKFWRLIRKLSSISSKSKSRIPALETKDGITTDPLEITNELASHFEKKFVNPMKPKSDVGHEFKVSETMARPQTSIEDFEKVLRSIDLNKAAGSDNISPAVIRSCASELAPVLHCLFNKIVDSGTWPRHWKVGRLVPLHKRGSNKLASNYRPICLLPILSRVCEGFFVAALLDHGISTGFISEVQYAYRPNHSTVHLVLSLIHDVVDGIQMFGSYHLRQEDIVSAFDRVHSALAVSLLECAGVRGKLLSTVRSFMSDRLVYVVNAGHSSFPFVPRCGVPQGSSFGPLIWLYASSPVVRMVVSSAGVRTYVFADDFNHSSESKQQIEKTSSVMSDGCRDCGFLLDDKKRVDTEFKKVAGAESRTSTRVLGIYLDTSLSMCDHIDNIIKSARKNIARIYQARSFLSNTQAKLLYMTHVLPILENGSPILQLMAKPSQLEKLDRIQKSFLRSFPMQLDSLSLRRTVGLYSIFYKISALNIGPMPLRKRWRVKQINLFKSVRLANARNPKPIDISISSNDCAARRRYAKAFESYNNLARGIFPLSPSLNIFKKNLAASLRSLE